MVFIIRERIYQFEVPTQNAISLKANKVKGRAHGKEEKYLQQVLVSLCFGPTKMAGYSAVAIIRTGGVDKCIICSGLFIALSESY